MARDGLLPRGFFAAVHERFHTPWKSTIGENKKPKLESSTTCYKKQSAIINGQAYKRKDALKTLNPDIPPFVVAQILPYEVLLECQGKILHLRYSDVYAGTELRKSMKPSVSSADVGSKREPKSKSAAPNSRSANKAKP